MKFAKELDEAAVPEWREKYLDYKQAKKRLKAVSRAIRNVDRSSSASISGRASFRVGTATSPAPPSASLRDHQGPVYAFLTRASTAGGDANYLPNLAPTRSRSAHASPVSARRRSEGTSARALRPVDERSPLKLNRMEDERDSAEGRPRMGRYGSIIGSPPSGNSPAMEPLARQRTQASLLELPDPALAPEGKEDGETGDGSAVIQQPRQSGGQDTFSPDTLPARPPLTQLAHQGNAYEVRQPVDLPHVRTSFSIRYENLTSAKRVNSTPDTRRPAFLKRIASLGGHRRSATLRSESHDVALEAYREVDFRQAEFFLFLDKSLDKIEQFYRAKEDEATERLRSLREQLHIMRNQRALEIEATERRHHHEQQRANGHATLPDGTHGHGDGHPTSRASGVSPETDSLQVERTRPSITHRIKSTITSQVDTAMDRVRPGHVGKTSKAMRDLGTPSLRLDPDENIPHSHTSNTDLDYVRRAPSSVSYRHAKRRLKTALVEYYRGLELLKSYALLNRTAFRKINKKYDKTVNARPTMRYMAEKVNAAHFTNSDKVDVHIQAVEDLYARYFERGNHKVAVGKLRAKALKAGQFSGSMFRTGFFAAAGFVLALLGLIRGLNTDISNPNPVVRTWASYLLQIYAGYFLLLLLVAIFCIDARVFTKAKVNYVFIFEFDTRDNLDWRQLSEIPAVFGFLLGLVMFLNFQWVGGQTMYLYWPVVLIGLSVIFLFFPAPIFYSRSRKWFLYSMQRLFFAGIYPVEFRDFFLGDMFCSLTYAMGNIELFFCLYAQSWSDPPQCNSSHSRLFGFFQTWPAIWRALQCLRRYGDTRAIYPHMVNFGKYGFTILSYMSLSLFRIQKTYQNLSLFIVFSSINSIYCIFWDVVNDWSLGNGYAKHMLLRNTLAYRYYWYYIAIVIDAIIRCNWVFYVIFRNDIQHSTVVSFAIALSEVLRRGMWTLFRVENEHCANVGKYRASRDVPLPYEVPSFDGHGETTTAERVQDEESAAAAALQQNIQSLKSRNTGRRWQDVVADSPVTLALKRVGTTLMSAHVQDYQRKKEPVMSKNLADSDDDDDQTTDEEEAGHRVAPGGTAVALSRSEDVGEEEDRQAIRTVEDAIDHARREE